MAVTSWYKPGSPPVAPPAYTKGFHYYRLKGEDYDTALSHAAYPTGYPSKYGTLWDWTTSTYGGLTKRFTDAGLVSPAAYIPEVSGQYLDQIKARYDVMRGYIDTLRAAEGFEAFDWEKHPSLPAGSVYCYPDADGNKYASPRYPGDIALSLGKWSIPCTQYHSMALRSWTEYTVYNNASPGCLCTTSDGIVDICTQMAYDWMKNGDYHVTQRQEAPDGSWSKFYHKDIIGMAEFGGYKFPFGGHEFMRAGYGLEALASRVISGLDFEQTCRIYLGIFRTFMEFAWTGTDTTWPRTGLCAEFPGHGSTKKTASYSVTFKKNLKFVDCLQLGPGRYEIWWLPKQTNSGGYTQEENYWDAFFLPEARLLGVYTKAELESGTNLLLWSGDNIPTLASSDTLAFGIKREGDEMRKTPYAGWDAAISATDFYFGSPCHQLLGSNPCSLDPSTQSCFCDADGMEAAWHCPSPPNPPHWNRDTCYYRLASGYRYDSATEILPSLSGAYNYFFPELYSDSMWW